MSLHFSFAFHRSVLLVIPSLSLIQHACPCCNGPAGYSLEIGWLFWSGCIDVITAGKPCADE